MNEGVCGFLDGALVGSWRLWISCLIYIVGFWREGCLQYHLMNCFVVFDADIFLCTYYSNIELGLWVNFRHLIHILTIRELS
jgi:hypothetical protein